MSRSLAPYVYHLAEEVNWPSIQQHGLLSTCRLLDLASVVGEERQRLGRQQRQELVTLPNGTVLRDQRPIPSSSLRGCLVGMTPSEWYALLNSKVFFWFDTERMNRQRTACGNRSQVVLVIDVCKLLDRHADRTALTPINTGNVRRKPALRGRTTFVPYATWRATGWYYEAEGLGTTPRARGHKPVELTIADAVVDVLECVVEVRELGEQKVFTA